MFMMLEIRTILFKKIILDKLRLKTNKNKVINLEEIRSKDN